MEVVILDERDLQFSPSWSWHDFNPNGKKVSSPTRKTLIPDVCLRQDNLPGSRADGVRPIIDISAMATIELLLGFWWSDTPNKPHTGLIELNNLRHFFQRVFESDFGWTEMVEVELIIHKLVNGKNCVLTAFQPTCKLFIEHFLKLYVNDNILLHRTRKSLIHATFSRTNLPIPQRKP